MTNHRPMYDARPHRRWSLWNRALVSLVWLLLIALLLIGWGRHIPWAATQVVAAVEGAAR